MNARFCNQLMKYLHQFGVRHICIAPGSRSAPLTLAAFQFCQSSPDEASRMQLVQHFDERGLAFLALGLAKSSQTPVVIITTSGTAVANLYPAVVEAYQSHVPLIVISADRPDTLLNCGANQAIDQVDLFHGNVAAALNVSELTEDRFLSIHDLMRCAMLEQRPVQLNIAFEDPLYDRHLEDFSLNAIDHFSAEPLPCMSEASFPSDTPLLVVGQVTPAQAQAILALAHRLNLPILADINSQLRTQTQANTVVIHHFDLLFQCHDFTHALTRYSSVLQFGGRIVSKALLQWLAQPKKEYILLDEQSSILDPSRTARQYQVNMVKYCQEYSANPPASLEHLKALIQQDQNMQHRMQPYLQAFSELSVVQTLLMHVPEHSMLFAGNSLSIRWLNLLAHGQAAMTEVASNRGASGIDGLVATAVGMMVAANQEKRPKAMTLLLGDTSLLHDLNSLALLNAQCQQWHVNMVIVVLNNAGGCIFNLLPAGKAENNTVKKEFFQLAHAMNFNHACAQFGLEYHQPCTVLAFEACFNAAHQRRKVGRAHLIEVNVDSHQATDLFTHIKQELADV